MTAPMLIIGAGPVGLAMAKAFGEHGIDHVVAEATDHVGGNWAHGVYETAHIISSRATTEYSDWPMPAEWPDFPSAAQMCRYFNDYADTFGLRDRIRFETEVTAVRRRRDEAWDVTFGDGTTQVFRGVVVCNGHHWDRVFPPWADDFTGELLHSKDYQRPDDLRGKRVLVIGGGNSGCDIVSEAARVGAAAHWSLRRGYWFLPKTFFGTPTVELVRSWMPIAVQRRLIKALLRVVVGRYEDYGLPAPDHEIFEAHPTVSTEVFHYLTHGRITPRPDVARVEGTTVHFADGTSDTFDTVVCATGYRVSFPFLEAGVVPVTGKVARLVGGILPEDTFQLYVPGWSQPRYGLGPLVRPAALLIAELVALQDELDVPLGRVWRRMGIDVPDDHLMDPHDAMRRIRGATRALPVMRWVGKRMARGREASLAAT